VIRFEGQHNIAERLQIHCARVPVLQRSRSGECSRQMLRPILQFIRDSRANAGSPLV